MWARKSRGSGQSIHSISKQQQIGGVFRKLSEHGGGTLRVAFPVYAGDLGGDPKDRAANVQSVRESVEAAMGVKTRERI